MKIVISAFLFQNEGSQIQFAFGVDMDIIAIFGSGFTLLYSETNLNLISFNIDKYARNESQTVAEYTNFLHLGIQMYG